MIIKTKLKGKPIKLQKARRGAKKRVKLKNYYTKAERRKMASKLIIDCLEGINNPLGKANLKVSKAVLLETVHLLVYELS